MKHRDLAPSEAPTAPGAASGGKTLAAAGFTAHHESRASKRRRAKTARGIELAARRMEIAIKQASIDAEKAERKAASYLPAGGETGPDALRSYRKFTVQPHRATSDVLAGAYAFLAEAGLGSDGTYIGQDAWSGSGFCYDPWVLYQAGIITNPNAVLAGVVGKGKSTLAKALATRSIGFGRKIYIPGDPKGEWTTVANAVGGQAIQLGGGTTNRLNPLDEGPRPDGITDTDWHTQVHTRRRSLLGSLTESSLGRPLHPVEHTALDVALATAVDGAAVPLLPMVVDALFDPRDTRPGATTEQLTRDGRDAGHALSRLVYGDLNGLFDGPSTVAFDPSLPMVSLDLSAIQGSDQLIALVMTCASTWMEAALTDPSGGPRWVIYDEAWRLLRNPALLARMQSQWKLSRALGIANLMIIHRFSDLDAVGDAGTEARSLALGLLADCSTKIIYAQEESEAPITGRTLGLGVTEQNELPGLARGEGLWKIGQRAFVVRHLCTPGELELFDTNSRMIAKTGGFPAFERKSREPEGRCA
jgi:hypothetical protein